MAVVCTGAERNDENRLLLLSGLDLGSPGPMWVRQAIVLRGLSRRPVQTEPTVSPTRCVPGGQNLAHDELQRLEPCSICRKPSVRDMLGCQSSSVRALPM